MTAAPAAFTATPGTCVPTHTSTPSGATRTVQLTGSIAAWAR